MQPLSRTVSVVIPFLQETDLVLEAMESVAKQTLCPLEVILVCNHETKVFPPVPSGLAFPVYQLHEPVRGSAYARNAGLAAAKGWWIQFLDVDDLLFPEKMERQTASEADIVLSPQWYKKVNGKIVGSKWQPEDVWAGLLESGLGATSSWLFRTTAVREVGGWNVGSQSHQEYELLFRLLQREAIVTTMPEALTLVRQRKSGSITVQTISTRPMEGLRLRESVLKYLEDRKQITPLRKEAFLRYVFGQLRGIHRYDPPTGLRVYQQYFAGKNFNPVDTGIPGYRWLYRIFGFRRTEKIMLLASRLRRRFSR